MWKVDEAQSLILLLWNHQWLPIAFRFKFMFSLDSRSSFSAWLFLVSSPMNLFPAPLHNFGGPWMFLDSLTYVTLFLLHPSFEMSSIAWFLFPIVWNSTAMDPCLWLVRILPIFFFLSKFKLALNIWRLEGSRFNLEGHPSPRARLAGSFVPVATSWGQRCWPWSQLLPPREATWR